MALENAVGGPGQHGVVLLLGSLSSILSISSLSIRPE
jgi:hypothetical protein